VILHESRAPELKWGGALLLHDGPCSVLFPSFFCPFSVLFVARCRATAASRPVPPKSSKTTTPYSSGTAARTRARQKPPPPLRTLRPALRGFGVARRRPRGTKRGGITAVGSSDRGGNTACQKVEFIGRLDHGLRRGIGIGLSHWLPRRRATSLTAGLVR